MTDTGARWERAWMMGLLFLILASDSDCSETGMVVLISVAFVWFIIGMFRIGERHD